MAEELRRRAGDTERPVGGLNIPVPDPSLLTTRALQREIFALRELIEVKLGSSVATGDLIRAVIETRLDGMDKAIRLLQDTADKFPGRIDEKIGALRSVHDERFGSIQQQFTERDVRTEQAAGAVKIAVDAALQAQKEAVGEQNKSSALAIAKSEASTMKQIDQQATLITQMGKGIDDKIDDLKERLTRTEGKGAGLQAGWGYLVAAIGLALAIYGFSARTASEVAAPAPQVIYVPAPSGTQIPVTTPATVPR